MPDATARAFGDHLTESSAPRERRRDVAPPRGGSAKRASDDSSEAGATERDDERDTPADGAGNVFVLPAQVTMAASRGTPVATAAGGRAESGDAAEDDATPSALASLLEEESNLAAALAENPLSDVPGGLPSPSERFPALLFKELPANLATQAGEQQDTTGGTGTAAEPAAPSADPATPAGQAAEVAPDKSESHAATATQGAPAHPAPPPAAEAPVTASQPAAEPADAGQVAPGRAALVTLPDLPARLARLAGRVLESGPSEVRLRLDPPSLGELRIHIGRDANGIHVRIVAQSQETLALLDNGQSRLREELERSGLALESFSTALDDGRQPGADPGDGSLYRNPPAAARPRVSGSTAEPAAPAAGAPDRAPGRPRGLDARV